MSEKTREVPKLADATYAHTLVIEITHESQGWKLQKNSAFPSEKYPKKSACPPLFLSVHD